MGMWKWITGAEAREKKWMETPRVLPEEFRKLLPGDDKFVVTGEFARFDSKNKHEYVAAVQQADGTWLRVEYVTDLKTGETKTYEGDHKLKTPLDVVKMMCGWHHSRANSPKNKDEELIHQMVAGQDATYFIFARRHGIQFDANNEPYVIQANDAASKKVFLKGKALTETFSRDEVDVDSYKTWDGLSKALALPSPNYAVFAKDANTLEFIEQTADQLRRMELCQKDSVRLQNENLLRTAIIEDIVAKYNNFTDVTSGKKKSPKAPSSKGGALSDMFNQMVSAHRDDDQFTHRYVCDEFSRKESCEYAQKVLAHTILYSLLDAGAHIYDAAKAEGIVKARHRLDLVKDIGNTVEGFAVKVLGLQQVQAKALSTLMTLGPNPNKVLPLRSFVDGYNTYLEQKPGVDNKNDI